jgi:hypothetical protein
MKPCVIFDIDGTCAIVDHRLHHVTNGKKDWKAFFEAMGDDTPNHAVLSIMDMCFGTHAAVFVVSGRPEKYRRMTIEWFENHEVSTILFEALLMRADGDHRPDDQVKREILENIRGQGFEPKWVVDDRQSVVDMWRSEGIVCLQCAPGTYNDTKRPVMDLKDQTLLTVMIGPSGAGKSEWIKGMGYPGRMVLSSDEIRADLCDGDFKDQSQNNVVFSAVHHIARERLLHGLPTVVDATNIRRKDRVAVAKLAPEDTVVQYVVIDRPMEQKIRDGGWRNDVIIKDIPLMQYHQNTFKSNLKFILAGDDLPNVRVNDLRILTL